MPIKRCAHLRRVVIDPAVLGRRKLSLTALGLYAHIAAAPYGVERAHLLTLCRGKEEVLAKHLAELEHFELVEAGQ